MSTNKLSSAFRRIAAVLLVGLLLAQGGLAGGFKINIEWGKGAGEKPSSKVAKALAGQVQQVQTRFAEKRGSLQIQRGAGNAPGYLSVEVTRLRRAVLPARGQ